MPALYEARWIACDESGWDGEQLLNGNRYLVYASVANDDAQADPVVKQLRELAGARQAPEWKFRPFKDRPDRREALCELWGPDGALAGRCSVYLVDKEYAVVAKVIDLLLEEQAHAAGVDLYAGGQVQRMARTLATQGRRALRSPGFTRLLSAFVALASARGRKDPEAAMERFYEELEAAWAASTRREVTEILFQLRGTRGHADLLQTMTCRSACWRCWSRLWGRPPATGLVAWGRSMSLPTSNAPSPTRRWRFWAANCVGPGGRHLPPSFPVGYPLPDPRRDHHSPLNPARRPPRWCHSRSRNQHPRESAQRSWRRPIVRDSPPDRPGLPIALSSSSGTGKEGKTVVFPLAGKGDVFDVVAGHGGSVEDFRVGGSVSQGHADEGVEQ